MTQSDDIDAEFTHHYKSPSPSPTIDIGEVSQMWDQSYKLEKNNALFFLETSLVYLGTSPNTIGKTS